MGSATLSFDTGDLIDRLERLKAEVQALTPAGLMSAADKGRDECRHKLSERGHPPLTKTPAPEGAPPALISGHLFMAQVSDGPTALSEDVWSARFGTSSHAGVNHYATHQAHGGPIGRKKAKTLHFVQDGEQHFPKSVLTPARPWMPSPAWSFQMLMRRMAEVWSSLVESA